MAATLKARIVEPVRAHPVLGVFYRVLIAVVGLAIVALGLVLVPAPGPGWLIVIGGLAVLATEFEWAHRLLHFTRRQVQGWTHWIMARPLWVRLLIGLAGVLLLVSVFVASLRYSGWHGFPFD